MTRKDYIGMCKALAEGVNTGKPIDAIVAWLKKDNPRFSEDKFRTFLGTLIEQENKHA